jgi:hypothetical protein
MTIAKIYSRASALILATSISTLGFAACVTSNGPVGNPGTWTADASGEILTYSGNGLSYTKCQLGTSGANCATGSVQTFDWQGALQASVSARIGGFDDWRLPNLQEAVALMEPTCEFPALSAAFPAASGGQQWTNTTSGALAVGDGAWNINSFAGVASVIAKTSLRAVLLVRGSSTPAGNFDSLPAANVTLTPSVATIGQTVPFNVVVSTGSPVAAVFGVSLNVLTQPSGPAASLTGSVFCSIPAGSSTCTVSGVQLTGPAGAYTLGASTAGGPAGGVTVNASPTIQLLSGPTATLTAPASATQFSPFDVVLSMNVPAAADSTFQLNSSGVTGVLAGGTSCTVPAGMANCTFSNLVFDGYGNGLQLSTTQSTGPTVAVSSTTMNVVGLPIDITMGSQATSQVGMAFNVIYNLSAALSFPVTMTSQQVGGSVGTFTPASCTIAAGATFCLAFGNTFSAVGLLVMEPLLTSSGNVLIGTKANATIDIVNQGATLSAPATVAQNTPFNVTLTLAAGELTNRTFTLSRASGPAGTLGGGLTCTVTAGNLSCTFTGVTFTGAGNALELTATVGSAPAIAVTNSFTDVTGVPLSYTISPITPQTAAINSPFSVTLQSTQPVAFDIPFTISVVSGTGGTLGGSTGCTILTGQTSCTITGVTYSALGSITLIANTTIGGAAFAFEQAAVTIVPAPVASAAVAVPTNGLTGSLALAALLAALGLALHRRRT